MSKCAKCKSTLSRVGDTWCLGCSGWESIGLELSSSWSSPGLRRIADDLVVQTARNLRALRSSGAGSGLAPAPEASASAPTPVKAPAVSLPPRSPVLEGVACKSKAGPGRAFDEESEYTYEYTEEEATRTETPKPKESTPPVRPALPRPLRESARPDRGEEVKQVIKEEVRSPRRERSRGHHTTGHRGRTERGEVRRNRRRSEERECREGGKRRKRKRGGRKHQRLARLEENPLLPHHRKLSTAFLEERAGLRD